MYKISFFRNSFITASSAAPQLLSLSEDAGIEARTVATSALAVRRSNHSARSHRFTSDIQVHSELYKDMYFVRT